MKLESNQAGEFWVLPSVYAGVDTGKAVGNMELEL